MKKTLIIYGTVAFGFIIPPLFVIIGNPKSGGPLGALGLLLMGISLRIIQELKDAEINEILSVSLAIIVHFAIYFFIGIGISKVACPNPNKKTLSNTPSEPTQD